MKFSHILLVAAALGAVPLAGMAYQASNGTKVVEGEAGSFEVLPASGEADVTALWCGAGDFVITSNLEPDDTLIYVLVPLGNSPSQPGTQSVVFTTQPTDAVKKNAVADTELTADTVGENITAFAAKDLCDAQ